MTLIESAAPAPTRFLMTAELSKRWQLADSTIRKWRSLGIGPPYIKLGGSVRYRLEDVAQYERATARDRESR